MMSNLVAPVRRLVLFSLLVGVACAAHIPAATAQPRGAAKYDAAAALNKALRQPMLAERITKAYTLVGQKVLEMRARRQMEDSLKEFATDLKDLQATAPTAEIKDNYQLLEQLFDDYRTLVMKPINLENARQLAEQNEELAWISRKGAMLIQAHSKLDRGELIAAAGDARTLSQRIAKLYLFRSWGIRSDVIANDLKQAEAEYRAVAEKLLRAPRNTPEITNELMLGETQWIFLKQAIDRLNANKTSPVELEHVTKACDNILEVMERVTRLYEGLKA